MIMSRDCSLYFIELLHNHYLSNINMKFAVNIWAVNWVWFMTSVLLWQIPEKMQAKGVNEVFVLAKSFRGLCSSSWEGYVARAACILVCRKQSVYPSLLPFLPIFIPSLCSFCEIVLSTFMEGLLLVSDVWKLSLDPQKYAFTHLSGTSQSN